MIDVLFCPPAKTLSEKAVHALFCSKTIIYSCAVHVLFLAHSFLFYVVVFFPFILTSSSLDVPAGVTQEEGHTGFLIHLPSAVHALNFLPRRIQPFLSLVDREVEFCVLTI